MKKTLKKALFFIIALVSFSGDVSAYTLNLTDEGRAVKWSSANQRIFINSKSERPLLDYETVEGIVANSITQWNATSSSINISGTIERDASPRNRINNLYFSSSNPFLGPSVAGVTVTVSDIQSGELIEANIIINDSLDIKSTPGTNLFLGDIVTHELGHFLGLAHSQVQFSSMFYRLNKSQNIVSSDDRAGARALYQPNTDARIRGKIVGGAGLTGIFGVHVQAISLTDGEVKSAVISAPDGRFTLNGLSHQEQYYLYIDKIDAIDTLPTFYNEVKTNFCQSSLSYRGSFFQSCFSRDIGFPQVLTPQAGSVLEVGEITVRCGLDVPIDYISQKPATDMELEIERKQSGVVNIGETLVGYFTNNEVNNNTFDSFRFSIGPDFLLQEDPTREFYLEIKAISQALYSPLRLEGIVSRSDGLTISSEAWDQIGTFSRLRPVLDTMMRIPIDMNNWSNNGFELQLTPYSITELVNATVYSEDDFYPDAIRFTDQYSFYLLTVHVVERLSGDVYVPASSKIMGQLTNNRLCPDAPLAYSVVSTKLNSGNIDASRSTAKTRDSDDPLSLGCGTIDLGDGSSGGASGLMILILSVICLLILTKESSKQIDLKY